MKKAAFTLIELLVVISIIAILAAIALPVFNAAQEKARVAQDASNLKNLGVGISTYLNDNDDMMFSQTSEEPWPILLHDKYVTDWRVFRSPFDKVTNQRPDKQVAPGVPVSYGINTNAYDVHTSKFKSPSELVLAAANPTPTNPIKFSGNSDTNVMLAVPGGSTKGGTHSNRNQINVLFADSHVSSMLWRDFSTTTGDDGLRRWLPEGKPPSGK